MSRRRDKPTAAAFGAVIGTVTILWGFASGGADMPTGGDPSTPPAASAEAGYDRDAFPHWSDLDGDGCDTRDEVLARAAIQSTDDDGDGCVDHVVIVDPYTGHRVAGRDQIDIDHVASLRDGWDSGADEWTQARREAFANDPANLVATQDDINREKSDRGPDEWQPPNPDKRCRYLTIYRDVKTRYGLAITGTQHRALSEGLARYCH